MNRREFLGNMFALGATLLTRRNAFAELLEGFQETEYEKLLKEYKSMIGSFCAFRYNQTYSNNQNIEEQFDWLERWILPIAQRLAPDPSIAAELNKGGSGRKNIIIQELNNLATTIRNLGYFSVPQYDENLGISYMAGDIDSETSKTPDIEAVSLVASLVGKGGNEKRVRDALQGPYQEIGIKNMPKYSTQAGTVIEENEQYVAVY